MGDLDIVLIYDILYVCGSAIAVVAFAFWYRHYLRQRRMRAQQQGYTAIGPNGQPLYDPSAQYAGYPQQPGYPAQQPGYPPQQQQAYPGSPNGGYTQQQQPAYVAAPNQQPQQQQYYTAQPQQTGYAPAPGAAPAGNPYASSPAAPPPQQSLY